MAAAPSSSQRTTLHAIGNLVAHSKEELGALKSPYELHQLAISEITAEMFRICTTSSDLAGEELEKKHLLIGKLSDERHELTMTYKESKRDNGREYKLQLDAAMQGFCDKLFALLGPDLVDTTRLRMGAQLPSPSSSAIRLISPPTFEIQSTQADGFQTVFNGAASAPIEIEDNSSNDNYEPTPEPEQESIQVHKKRPSIRRDSSTSRKRPRISSPPLTQPTMTFEEVFQDGKAPVKHKIVQYPKGVDSWYIIRCSQHNKNFTNSPLRQAGVHLKSSSHGHFSKAFKHVVQYFGIRILNCSQSLADKNNDVAMSSFVTPAGGGGINVNNDPTLRIASGTRQPGTNQVPIRTYRQGQPVRQAVAGQLYEAFWKVKWIPVLILPFDNLSEFGIPGTLETYKLTDSVPECLTYDRFAQTFVWKEEYGEGGPLANQRQFPALYFTEGEFPEETSAGWVSACDLQEFNMANCKQFTPLYHESVKNYLKRRQQQARTLQQSSGTSAASMQTRSSPLLTESRLDSPSFQRRGQETNLGPARSDGDSNSGSYLQSLSQRSLQMMGSDRQPQWIREGESSRQSPVWSLPAPFVTESPESQHFAGRESSTLHPNEPAWGNINTASSSFRQPVQRPPSGPVQEDLFRQNFT